MFTEFERAVLSDCDNLANHYQSQYNLAMPPRLMVCPFESIDEPEQDSVLGYVENDHYRRFPVDILRLPSVTSKQIIEPDPSHTVRKGSISISDSIKNALDLMNDVVKEEPPEPTYGPQLVATAYSNIQNSVPRTPNEYVLKDLLLKRVKILRTGSELFFYNGKFYEPLTDNGIRTVIRKYLDRELELSGKVNPIKAVIELLKCEPDIEAEPEDDKLPLLCVRNGLLDLNTGNLLPHDVKFFLTSAIEVDWKKSTNCPNFMNLLHFNTNSDPEMMERYLQVLGYILTTDNNAKAFFLLRGVSDSGKSIWGKLIQSFFNKSAVFNSDTTRIGERFGLAPLVRKRVNLAMDLPNKVLDPQVVSIIKQITGLDDTPAEKKYGEEFTGHFFFKFVFGSNHELKLASQDSALLRRCIELPFPNTVPEHQQDHNLLDKLLAEREAILYLAINAYWRLRSNNYIFAGSSLVTPGVVVEGDKTNLDEQILTFLQSFYQAEVLQVNPHWIAATALFKDFQCFYSAFNLPMFFNYNVFCKSLKRVLSQYYPMVREGRHRNGGNPQSGYFHLVPLQHKPAE